MLISLVGTRYMATNFVHDGHSDGRTRVLFFFVILIHEIQIIVYG